MQPVNGDESGRVIAEFAHRFTRPCTPAGMNRSSSRFFLAASRRLQLRGSLSSPMPSGGESDPKLLWLSWLFAEEGDQQPGRQLSNLPRRIHFRRRDVVPVQLSILLAGLEKL